MNHIHKMLFIILLISISYSTYAENQSTDAAYFLSIIGFGMGHFYLGDDAAFLFLIAELVTSGTMFVGIGLLFHTFEIMYEPGSDAEDLMSTSMGLIGLGFLAHVIMKIWEIVDIHHVIKGEKKPEKVSYIAPYIELTKAGFLCGYRYSF